MSSALLSRCTVFGQCTSDMMLELHTWCLSIASIPRIFGYHWMMAENFRFFLPFFTFILNCFCILIWR